MAWRDELRRTESLRCITSSAIADQVPGTEYFRNVIRHPVVTDSEILSLRVDESLCCPNARFLEDQRVPETAF